MKARKLGQIFAWVLWVSACNVPGECKIGKAGDCPPEAVCYGGAKAKAGDKGICALNAPGDSAPLISDFSPAVAAHGASLHIRGANFSATPSQNSVTLNGLPAVVLSATENQIEVKVPKSMHCTGLITVTVHDKTAVSATPFTYLPTAIVSTFAGSGKIANADCLNAVGTAACFNYPNGIIIDRAGNLLVAETYGHRVRKISPNREVSTFAGSGIAGFSDGSLSTAQFRNPNGLAIDKEGHVYVADYSNHRIRKILTTDEVSTFAGSGDRNLRDATGTAAQFDCPDGIVLGTDGTLYVADSMNNSIRKISPTGEVNTIAGSRTSGFADGAGNDARFNYPNEVALDAEGNLYVADSDNNRIRKILPTGEVSTLAGNGMADFLDGPGDEARFHFPHGMAVDNNNGNLYVADVKNHRIRMVTPSGEVSTLAGGGATGNHVDGTGSAARFNSPHGIVMDAEGTLYVADSDNHRIRKITLE